MFSFVNMKTTGLKNILKDDWHEKVKLQEISGRYLNNDHLEKIIEVYFSKINIEEIGRSVKGESIRLFKIGSRKKKILIWSQMHGNESTTTKAVLDLCHAFLCKADNEILQKILSECSLYIIPILNPDGARAYTRVNANQTDLNRDMQELTQPESRVLKEVYNKVKPDYCLNLHDQRTIFSAGAKRNPATLSFLTPSKDAERKIDDSRKISMGLIAGIAADLKNDLPEMIGRYDDAYNINCAGDTFQSLSTPTLLFEAGHYPGDYLREITRKYVFKALLSVLTQISMFSKEEIKKDFENYFVIPENKKLYKDIIIREAKVNGKIVDLAIHYREKLLHEKIEFEPVLEKIAPFISGFGHREIMAENETVAFPEINQVVENVIVNKIILKNKKRTFKEG